MGTATYTIKPQALDGGDTPTHMVATKRVTVDSRRFAMMRHGEEFVAWAFEHMPDEIRGQCYTVNAISRPVHVDHRTCFVDVVYARALPA